MSQSFNTVNPNQIYYYYEKLGSKKFLKSIIKDLNLNKRMFLYYSKYRNIPICTLPKLRIIFASKKGFVYFCCNFINFTNTNEVIITPCINTINCIAKFVIYHEIGHILDPDISLAKEEYTDILTSIVNKLITYDIDICNDDFYKQDLPYDLEECVVSLKKNVITRESKAWDIAKSLTTFDSEYEELIFNKMRQYALATYNFGNIKNIVRDNNIDVYFKYKRFFKEKVIYQ